MPPLSSTIELLETDKLISGTLSLSVIVIVTDCDPPKGNVAFEPEVFEIDTMAPSFSS